MAGGGWWIAGCGWRVADGVWRVAGGGWRVADCGEDAARKLEFWPCCRGLINVCQQASVGARDLRSAEGPFFFRNSALVMHQI